MKFTIRSLVATSGVCLASVVFAADQGQPPPTVDVTQLPAPVQTTLQQEGARISKVEQQTDNGQTVYKATLSKAGKNYSLRLGSDGKVMNREEMTDSQQKSQ